MKARALRALKYARIPGTTVPEACARYGLTRSQYYRLRKELIHGLTWTLEDILLSMLVRGGACHAADLVEYVDWQDHARYAPEEIDRVFEKLSERGLVERTPAGWRLRAEWP
jgi:hypothetical protein